MDIPTPASLPPALWGRNTWEFIEMLIISYPISNPPFGKRDAVLNFFENLGELLPCTECASHYKTFIQTESLEDHVQGRSNLFEFYYRLRSNIAGNTQSSIPSREEVWRNMLTRYHLHPSIKRTPVRAQYQPTPQDLTALSAVKARRRGCNCG